MKKFLLGVAIAVLMIGLAYAIQTTPTPPVAPEDGENNQSQSQILDAARLKPGYGTAAITVAASAGAATVNNAAGLLTLTSATAGASGTTPTVLTITNNKAFTTDFAICQIASGGFTAGAVPNCSSNIAANGTLTLTILNGSVTAMTASTIKVAFLIITAGNPN